jgi:hypothetical protein
VQGASIDERPWSEGQKFMAWAFYKGSWSRNKKMVQAVSMDEGLWSKESYKR